MQGTNHEAAKIAPAEGTKILLPFDCAGLLCKPGPVGEGRRNHERHDPAVHDFADLSRFLRRAGVIACAVLAIAGAAAYRQYRDEAKFADLRKELGQIRCVVFKPIIEPTNS